MNMLRWIAIVWTLVLPFSTASQQRKLPISISHVGHDEVGSLLLKSLNREISKSSTYEVRFSHGINPGLRFDLELNTVDVADNQAEHGKRSVASIVIQEMGLPNSYPVANMWYHKIIVVDKGSVDKIAADLLEDISARWCQYPKNSVGGCPKEKFEPRIYDPI
jgi:hypothetical protein